MSSTSSNFGGLPQQLINKGIVSEAFMKTALLESQQQQVGLVSYLVANKMADAYALAQLLSKAFECAE